MQIGLDVIGVPDFASDHIDIDVPPPQGTTVEIGAERFTVQELILRQPADGSGAHYIARLSAKTLPDKLCAEIIWRHASLAGILNDPSDAAAAVRQGLYGEIHALRVALCLVMGWDPATEAGKEERADQYVTQWQDTRAGST